MSNSHLLKCLAFSLITPYGLDVPCTSVMMFWVLPFEDADSLSANGFQIKIWSGLGTGKEYDFFYWDDFF